MHSERSTPNHRASEAPAPGAPRQDRPEILVAEDEDAFRELLSEYLQLQGYMVHTAANGVEALRQLKLHKVRLMISDVCMPDMDGLELLNQVRKHHPVPRIIAISGGAGQFSASVIGDDTDLFLKMAKSLGAQHILAKPFPLKDLLDRVQATIGPGAV